MHDYIFSTDWAEWFVKNATELFLPLAGQPISYLEIGVYEARSAVWMLDNVLTHPLSKYCGVDLEVRPNGWKNLAPHRDKVVIYEGDSKVIVPRLNQKFDIVYIDGDHSAKGALFDSVAAWPLATKYLLWDDYRNVCGGCVVGVAVRNFLACIPYREFKVIVDNYQFGVEKLKHGRPPKSDSVVVIDPSRSATINDPD